MTEPTRVSMSDKLSGLEGLTSLVERVQNHGMAENLTGLRDVPGSARTSGDIPPVEVDALPLSQPVAASPAPVHLPPWTHVVITMSGDRLTSRTVDHGADGVTVRYGSRRSVFVPYFNLDRIESER